MNRGEFIRKHMNCGFGCKLCQAFALPRPNAVDWYRPPLEPETMPDIPVAEPALVLIEASEPSDTDRPPPMDLRRCYWCSEPATDIVHGDIPCCEACKRRARGRKERT